MTHKYTLSGMTCSNCETKVKSSMLLLPGITSVEVSKDHNTANITMSKHVALSELQQALGGRESKYQISALQHNEIVEETKSWLQTYKPILLIFFYISLVSTLIVYTYGLYVSDGMSFFMAQFFLVFSFFKFLNLKAFAESYAMYDIVAKNVKAYGYVYPFIELALGLLFLTQFHPVFTNTLTIIVMGVSSVGVIQSVMNKQNIKCACLGAVFNLPMSTVTIIEDLLMVSMSSIFLIFH